MRAALGLGRRCARRPACTIEARHEILGTVRTRPRPMMARALLPQPPDRRLDVLDRCHVPKVQPAFFVVHDADHPAPACRGDRAHEFGIGVAAPFDEAQRIALPFHVGEHLVVLIDQRERRRIGFERRRRSCMRETKRHARDHLAGLGHALAARELVSQRRRTIEQGHHARLELLGQELLVRANVQDRRRPLVEPLAGDVEHRLGLAGLRGRHDHDALAGALGHGALERDDVGRQPWIARAWD